MFTTRITDVSREESEAILAYLIGHCAKPEFQMRFRWRNNSIAFWDNRCVQHLALWDYSLRRVRASGSRSRASARFEWRRRSCSFAAMLNDRRILLIVSGSVAAYKALDLTRLLRKAGATVTAVLTAGGARFVTKEALAGITGQRVHDDLWAAEAEIGHIRLARLPDLVVVAPASADLLAKMANGLADDLASTILLATRAPILVAPAMNPAMWDHPATRADLTALAARGVQVVGPGTGAMAEPESGPGRLSEPAEILAAIEALLAPAGRPLAGRHALVTAGPTHEPIDPVRYIANRSSGKQGYAIAAALAALGARVTLVSGPTALPDPRSVAVVRVESAREMLAACEAALPADIAVMAAAVADWRMAREATQKLKKAPGAAAPVLEMWPEP